MHRLPQGTCTFTQHDDSIRPADHRHPLASFQRSRNLPTPVPAMHDPSHDIDQDVFRWVITGVSGGRVQTNI